MESSTIERPDAVVAMQHGQKKYWIGGGVGGV
jgi:hypothetical protein